MGSGDMSAACRRSRGHTSFSVKSARASSLPRWFLYGRIFPLPTILSGDLSWRHERVIWCKGLSPSARLTSRHEPERPRQQAAVISRRVAACPDVQSSAHHAPTALPCWGSPITCARARVDSDRSVHAPPGVSFHRVAQFPRQARQVPREAADPKHQPTDSRARGRSRGADRLRQSRVPRPARLPRNRGTDCVLTSQGRASPICGRRKISLLRSPAFERSVKECVEKSAVRFRDDPNVVLRLVDVSPVPHTAVFLHLSGNGRLHSTLTPRSLDSTIANLAFEILRRPHRPAVYT
jgi:hypothetical protein